MNPNFELIRLIMIRLETDLNGSRLLEEITRQGKNELEMAELIEQLERAGLIDACISLNEIGIPCGFNIWGMTSAGHDFIKSAKNSKIWYQALDQLKKRGTNVRLPVLAEILKWIAKNTLELSRNRDAVPV